MPLPKVDISLSAFEARLLHGTLRHFARNHTRWQIDPSFNRTMISERLRTQPDAGRIVALTNSRAGLRPALDPNTRLNLDHDELAALGFAAREAPKLWRLGALPCVRQSPARGARRLRHKLEIHRRRARKAARQADLPVVSSDPEWRLLLGWVRRHLRSEEKLPKRVQLSKSWYRLWIAEAVHLAKQEIAQAGLEGPAEKYLRRAVREAFHAGRRNGSRQPSPLTMLRNPGILFKRVRRWLPRLRRLPEPRAEVVAPPPPKPPAPPKPPKPFIPKPPPKLLPEAEIAALKKDYDQLAVARRKQVRAKTHPPRNQSVGGRAKDPRKSLKRLVAAVGLEPTT